MFEVVCDFVNRKLNGPGLVGTAKTVKPEILKVRDENEPWLFVGADTATIEIIQYLVIPTF